MSPDTRLSQAGLVTATLMHSTSLAVGFFDTPRLLGALDPLQPCSYRGCALSLDILKVKGVSADNQSEASLYLVMGLH